MSSTDNRFQRLMVPQAMVYHCYLAVVYLVDLHVAASLTANYVYDHRVSTVLLHDLSRGVESQELVLLEWWILILLHASLSAIGHEVTIAT